MDISEGKSKIVNVLVIYCVRWVACCFLAPTADFFKEFDTDEQLDGWLGRWTKRQVNGQDRLQNFLQIESHNFDVLSEQIRE